MTFEEVFNMRKYARQASRDAYSANNSFKGNALKGSSNDLSLLINAKIDLFEKKGVDNLNYRGAAQDFRFAETSNDAFSDFIDGLCYYFSRWQDNKVDRDKFIQACGFENGLYPEEEYD